MSSSVLLMTPLFPFGPGRQSSKPIGSSVQPWKHAPAWTYASYTLPRNGVEPARRPGRSRPGPKREAIPAAKRWAAANSHPAALSSLVKSQNVLCTACQDILYTSVWERGQGGSWVWGDAPRPAVGAGDSTKRTIDKDSISFYCIWLLVGQPTKSTWSLRTELSLASQRAALQMPKLGVTAQAF